MKRVGGLFDAITAWENLVLATYRAAQGKRDRPAVRDFLGRLERELASLRRDLCDDRLGVGRYRQFRIQDPKPRTITAPCFRERVLHHAIMNVCEPYFERWQCDQSFACRVGKGRVVALRHAVRMSQRFGFFIKMDVRRFFESIPHNQLLALLERRFKDPRLLRLFRAIVEGFEVRPGVGLPIGSLTSQHFANFYLSAWDRQLGECFGARAHARYMDDCLVWAPESGSLVRIAEQSRRYLQRDLGLGIKPYGVQRVDQGVPFLGFVLNRDGARLNRRSRLRLFRRTRDYEGCYLRGKISGAVLQERVTALYAFRNEGRAL